MMYGTGIRVTEISSLRMSDVNSRIGFIACTGEYGKARIIPLGRPCREALERYLDESRPKLLESYLRRRAEQEMSGTESADDRDAGRNESPQEYIFMNYHGERLTRQGLWKIVRTYAKGAGVEKRLNASEISGIPLRYIWCRTAPISSRFRSSWGMRMQRQRRSI